MENEYTDLYDLHVKYSTGPFKEKWVDLVWTHSNIILEITQLIRRTYESKNNTLIDNESLINGTLLHDIGVYKCYDNDFNKDPNLPSYINHGFLGAKIIDDERLPLSIQRFALTHTATGFTKNDIIREKLPYPVADYIPTTIEEEILCYADKFHSKYPKFTVLENEINKISTIDSSRRIKMQEYIDKFGIPDLTGIKNKYYNWHINFENWLKYKS